MVSVAFQTEVADGVIRIPAEYLREFHDLRDSHPLRATTRWPQKTISSVSCWNIRFGWMDFVP